MNENEFVKFLNDNSWKTDKKTVEQLLDLELEKRPEDINMEFVDACIDYLTEQADNEKNHLEKDRVVTKQKRKTVKLNRILIAAIITALCVGSAITAYAKVNDISITDAIVNVFSDYATIDYSNKNTGDERLPAVYNESELYKELQNGGIENIVLPRELYSMEYEKIEWTVDFTEKAAFVLFDDQKTSMLIHTFNDEKWVTDIDIQGEFTNCKKVTVNGIDMYLFERNGDKSQKVNTSISYQIGLTQYDIQCSYSIEQAEEILKNMN